MTDDETLHHPATLPTMEASGVVGCSAVSWGPDRIDVVAPGRDGDTWHRSWDGSQWVEWEQLRS